MASVDKCLIIIKGEDKTAQVKMWFFDRTKPVVYITFFGNNNRYPYNTEDVAFFDDPRPIEIRNKIIIKNGKQILGVSALIRFGKYIRVIYRNNANELCKLREIKVVGSELDKKGSKLVFDYLKKMSERTGVIADDINILLKEYDDITFLREDSVFAHYLSGEKMENDNGNSSTVVFPFGFNISQKSAVNNAITNCVSIIEGPPGTGKTQTILNIIANAIIHGESVAVVSNNNSATQNVYEKLQKYGLDFIVAKLGNKDNKDKFIEEQPLLPDLIGWKGNEKKIVSELKEELSILEANLQLKNEQSVLNEEYAALKKEKTYFDEACSCDYGNESLPQFNRRANADMILTFAAEYEFMKQKSDSLTFLQKATLAFKYGVWKYDFANTQFASIESYCKRYFYEQRISEIEDRLSKISEVLDSYDFDKKIKEYTHKSMLAFRAYLSAKYANQIREQYDLNSIKSNSERFANDYPVVLSTTYSLKRCLSSEFLYDYVIIDEASQVDVVTGALALSCAKKAVIVGDQKQLPNVVTNAMKDYADIVKTMYQVNNKYEYSSQSLLSSVKNVFFNAPTVLLKEHYRCSPEIIGFCNRMFYNDSLVIMAERIDDQKTMTVYKTVAGNMARGHINERQIQVIKDEVIPSLGIDVMKDSVGIITPYRAQAERMKEIFAGTNIQCDTVDKFQGQEKQIIIFSTVDNEIGEFVSNPNRLNVAVSRAVSRFVVVTDGNENDNSSPIHDLIDYIQYNNHQVINSEIHSVFDYLYKEYAQKREKLLDKYGRVSEFDSENILYALIKDIINEPQYNKFDVVLHVPFRELLGSFDKLDGKELMFASNHLSHIDFLIFSKLSKQPILAIEVDGYAYHRNEKQAGRDSIKDNILRKYNIPILRLSTVDSCERKKITQFLDGLL